MYYDTKALIRNDDECESIIWINKETPILVMSKRALSIYCTYVPVLYIFQDKLPIDILPKSAKT